MHALNLLPEQIEVKVGEKIYYVAEVHTSVGIEAKVWPNNESILKIVDQNFTYDHPQKENITGGDGGKETYIFEVLKEGKTEVVIQKIFRGDLEQEHTVNVTVVRR